MSAIGVCTAASCLSTGAVAAIFGGCAGVWALGYGMGQAVQWTRRIVDAA